MRQVNKLDHSNSDERDETTVIKNAAITLLTMVVVVASIIGMIAAAIYPQQASAVVK